MQKLYFQAYRNITDGADVNVASAMLLGIHLGTMMRQMPNAFGSYRITV